MGKRNSKRAVKKARRQVNELQGVIDQAIMVLNENGFPIEFPWEIPHAIRDLASRTRAGGQDMSVQQAGASVQRLAQMTGQQVAPQAPQAAPAQAHQPASPPAQSEPAPMMDWDDLGDELLADLDSSSSSQTVAAPSRPSPPQQASAQPVSAQPVSAQPSAGPQPAPPPMSMEEMKRLVEQKQARMIDRVQTQGVQYGMGAGPAEGKKMAPHPSVKIPPTSPHHPQQEVSPPPVQEQQPQADGRGASDAGDGEYVSPYGGGSNGERVAKNGMTREEMVRAIEQATGKAPGAPGSNPVPKPPGM